MSDQDPPSAPQEPQTPAPPAEAKKLRIVRGPGKKTKRDPKAVATPNVEPATQLPAKPDRKTGKHLKCAPEGVRCQMMVTHKDGAKERCTRYTVKLKEGGRAAYCISHDDAPASRAIVIAGAQKAAEMNAAAHSDQFKDLERRIGQRPMLTQDDIAAERQRIMYQLAMKIIPAASGNALLNALQQASNHIELFGGKQGVEGGAGYLRLLPGVRLVEQLDDKNRPLTSEEMKTIYELQAIDIKKGIKPPVGWAECILKYLGLQREPEVGYNEKQEPIGEYRCEIVKDAKTGETSILKVFVPYKSRDMTKRRLEDEKAAEDRLRGK